MALPPCEFNESVNAPRKAANLVVKRSHVGIHSPETDPRNSTPWAKELRSPTSHSNRSLRTEVSVAGKRNFQGRDKEAETALEIQGRRCRDKISLGNSANSGLIVRFREISVRTRMRGGGRSHCRTGLSHQFPWYQGQIQGNNRNAAVRRSLTTKKPSCHGTLLTNSLSNRTGNDLRENRDRNIR